MVDDQRTGGSSGDIKYRFRDLQLDYNSFFQLSCQKDQIYTFTERPQQGDSENTIDPTSIGVCDLKVNSGESILDPGRGMYAIQNQMMSANSSYLEFQFVADAQLQSKGILIEWWSSDYSDPNTRPESCFFNDTQLAVSSQNTDEIFGIVYDCYHGIYIFIILFIIFFFLYKFLIMIYNKIRLKEPEYLDPEEDEDSDMSDDESDDESDIYDQYDLDQDEDDVDDFSLLTLLEMKANRTELGSAVEKLTNEIDHLENNTQMIDLDGGDDKGLGIRS